MGTNRNDGYHGGKPMPRYIIPEPAPNQIFDTPETKTITEAIREVEVFTEVMAVSGWLAVYSAYVGYFRKKVYPGDL